MVREDGRRARGGRLRLHEALVEQLRIVRRAGEEQPLGGEIHRAQFDVGLEEPTVGVHRHFEFRAEFARAVGGNQGRGEHQQVGAQFNFYTQNGFPNAYGNW